MVECFSLTHLVFQNINSANSSFLPEREKKDLVNKLYEAYGMVENTVFLNEALLKSA